MLGTVLIIAAFMNYRFSLEYCGCFEVDEWNWEAYNETLIEAFFGPVDMR